MEILYINIGHIIAKIGRLFRLQIHRIVDNIASKTSIYSTLSHNNILYIEVFLHFNVHFVITLRGFRAFHGQNRTIHMRFAQLNILWR